MLKNDSELLQLQTTNQSNELKISDLISSGDSSESMIREMIAEREIIEKSLSSTKENFSRIEADYQETRAQLKLKTDELLTARQSITVSVKLSKISQVLDRILIEHKKPKCSQESKLFFIFVCSIRIRSRIRVIFKKTGYNSFNFIRQEISIASNL